MMVTIGWPILLLLLVIGLRLGGVALGLLSGLGLGLLTFSVQPTAPPNDLMLLQAAWLLLMATLEAAGFFYLLETKLRAYLTQANRQYGLLVALLCYSLVFLTGDQKWLHRLLRGQDRLYKERPQLLLPMRIAAHMALLASPLSISGILLIVVAGSSGLAILDLIGTIFAITVSITAASSLLTGPNTWLLNTWSKPPTKDDAKGVTTSTNKVQLVLLPLLLAAVLFLLIQPEANRFTGLSGKIFPIRFPIFFVLVMLSIAAVAMLWLQIKPAQILQTHRFKVGIQQFYIFLGLTWLLDSLISHEKAYLMNLLSNGSDGFYLMAALYILLIDIPIIIWLFTGLLMAQHHTTLTLALWLVGVHSLAPVRGWLSHIVQGYKKNKSM